MGRRLRLISHLLIWRRRVFHQPPGLGGSFHVLGPGKWNWVGFGLSSGWFRCGCFLKQQRVIDPLGRSFPKPNTHTKTDRRAGQLSVLSCNSVRFVEVASRGKPKRSHVYSSIQAQEAPCSQRALRWEGFWKQKANVLQRHWCLVLFFGSPLSERAFNCTTKGCPCFSPWPRAGAAFQTLYIPVWPAVTSHHKCYGCLGLFMPKS